MPRAGIEPATQGFSVPCSTDWAIWACLLSLLNFCNNSCGDRIWTYDLRVMSPTSFQTAPPRDIKLFDVNLGLRLMGRGGFEPPKQFAADLQSVPFGHSGIHPFRILNYIQLCIFLCKKPMIGLEPITCWLQISCSAIEPHRHKMPKYLILDGAYRARTCDPLLVRQMLSQLS